MTDPQVLHNGTIQTVAGVTGAPISLVMHPVKYDGETPAVRLAPSSWAPRPGKSSANSATARTKYATSRRKTWCDPMAPMPSPTEPAGLRGRKEKARRRC